MGTPRRTALALLFLAIAFSVHAAPAPPAGPKPGDAAAPSTAVARLKIVKGTAWVRPADSGEWEEYSHNSPVVERSRLSIPHGSEAEIQFRGSQFLLLQSGSEVDVRQLGEGKASFRLRTGQVAFSLSKDDFAPVAVKIPGTRDVSLDTPGLYWVTVEGEATKLNVRHGEGTVSGKGAKPVTVKAGEVAAIDKDIRVSQGAAPDLKPAPETTLSDAERKAGVPPGAATELRDYGDWVWTSEYGYVWRPYVADEWAPYYYGRWTWVYPYGWNWVAYEPWGWWPYHYGWWVTVGAYGWCWAPYNAFYYSGSCYYRGYSYPYRYGYYCSGNVRFVNDGRHVRWVPARPGETTTRSAGFSRGDARLAQWNRPIPGGTVTSRPDGGRPAAAGGRGGAGVSARTGGAAGMPRTGLSRPSPEGGGRVSAVPAGRGVSARSAGGGAASYRGPASGGQGRASAYPGARGYDAGPRGYQAAPRGSFDAGRAYGGPARSFDGTDARGSFGGSRGFEGGRGGGVGSRGQGGGSGGSWGGGGRGAGGGFGGGTRQR